VETPTDDQLVKLEEADIPRPGEAL
jgi:hypothetical protein